MSKNRLPQISPLRPIFKTKNHPTFHGFLWMLLPCKTKRPWYYLLLKVIYSFMKGNLNRSILSKQVAIFFLLRLLEIAWGSFLLYVERPNSTMNKMENVVQSFLNRLSCKGNYFVVFTIFKNDFYSLFKKND